MNTAIAMEPSWIDLREAAALFGMSVESARNSVAMDRFPVPTYKLGKRRVIDKDVLAAFFAGQKAEGLQKLKDMPPMRTGKRRP